ncbi:hypothetical protein HG530_010549 [Fusarium avenaceum]|nr:hypothetical protein HG530_010549 [Fusarium avenaceum]
MLFLNNSVVIKINDQLEKLIAATFSFDRNLDSSAARWDVLCMLSKLLLLKENDHFFLAWLQESDDPEVEVLISEVRARDTRSLNTV